MNTVQYLRWNPLSSPLRIEFAPDLLPSLRPQCERADVTGVLYGIRRGREVRLLAAGSSGEGEAGPPGMEPVGIYVWRVRGEVFLTESELELFEKRDAAVALVVAGARAGFFVREFNGSIQTVRSYEEFFVRRIGTDAHTRSTSGAQAPPEVPVATKLIPDGPPQTRTDSRISSRINPRTKPGIDPRIKPRISSRPVKRAWPNAGLVLLAALPVAALAYLHPVFPQSPTASQATRALQVHEEDGQLHISWKRGEPAILEIAEGNERTSVPVRPDQASATYVPQSGEVEIGLVHVDGSSPRREERVRFSGTAPAPLPPDPALAPIRQEIVALQAEADGLRSGLAAGGRRIRELQKAIARLTGGAEPTSWTRAKDP
jgi:hypothetical protein